jgi:uncharacterized protein YidB (DUF937 family)
MEQPMSRGFPSMTALLGLLAIAGYQNREKIAEWLGGLKQSAPGTAGQGGAGGLLEHLKGSLGSTSAGGVLSGGLGELVDRFKQSGQGETADSWVKTGPNKPVTPSQLEQAIGPEILDTLSKQNGIVAERAARKTVPRTSRRCRQIHSARAAADGGRAFTLLRRHGFS